MESLLTVNQLGYLCRSGERVYLDSESGTYTTTLNKGIQEMLIDAIIVGQDNIDAIVVGQDNEVNYLDHSPISLIFNHDLGEVTLQFFAEEATFNQVLLVQFINVERVRELKLAQAQRTQKQKDLYL